ncbi:neurotrypsin [Octopus sinensis]|uniref:Neurotrypsin n=1 Tax=Octopus sinensis TaxID=2607531 RepID=A0A6P7SR15_9MOLL|nr:neurotrypsin [Octopus sinensis]
MAAARDYLQLFAYLLIFTSCCGMLKASSERIRLADGSKTDGRVELFHNGTWGTICDDSWDNYDAKVVCRMLGLSDGTAFTKAWFSQGKGEIFMSEVQCLGSELSIWECPFKREHFCSHREDASVVCSERRNGSNIITTTETPKVLNTGNGSGVRLVGGDNNTHGRVEVFHEGIWGTICDDWWDVRNAIVVCRMIGFSTGKEHKPTPGDGPIWLDDVKCKGWEEKISDCDRKNWGDHDCFHNEDAGVICQ